MRTVRILLAEDHRVMREGLRIVLDREPGLAVVGEADSGLTAIALAQELRPHIVIMDISMPELNGLKATEALKKLTPDVKVLILTRHLDRSYVQQLILAGASGYVLKQSASEDLVRAIMRVAAGHTYLDPAITDQVVDSLTHDRGTRGFLGKSLSVREEDVLRFVALGFLAKEIAVELGIGIKTVETHKAHAMSKLGMTSRIDIVHYAVLQGWLQDT